MKPRQITVDMCPPAFSILNKLDSAFNSRHLTIHKELGLVPIPVVELLERNRLEMCN